MQQEDDLRALAKIMDFLRAVSRFSPCREYYSRSNERLLVLLCQYRGVAPEYRRC